MAVDAVYLLDEKKHIRRVIVWDVYELIHDEATYELDAEIASEYGAKPGEFLGFSGIGGKFILFEIDKAEIDDKRGVMIITATDAAVKELSRLVTREIRLTAANVRTATEAALDGSGWEIGRMTDSGRTADLSKYYEKRWKVLREIAVQWQTRVTPYFIFEKSRIVRRVVDVTERENIYRGRLFEGATGAGQIFVTFAGSPVTRLYGVGKAIGTEDPPVCVTFRDAVWSKAAGDPIDKPAGQDYIEDEEGIALFGDGREDVFTDKNIEDQYELLEATFEHLMKIRRPKVSGSAVMSDMEHIPGYEHLTARQYDLVWVRTRNGTDVSAVIINVKRNYMRGGMTKIYVGEEADDSGLIKKIAKLSSTSSSLSKSSSAQANRYIETKRLIQLNADTIQMNARLIEANAEFIRLTASNLKEYEESTDGRLTLAELTLYGDGTSAGAGLVARVDDHSASLILQADELGTLAEIKADKVELGKYATVERLEAELADFELSLGDSMTLRTLNVTGATTTDSLNATSASLGTVRIDGYEAEWKSIAVVTDVPLMVNATGGVVTGVTANPVRATLYYLSR